MIYKIIKNLSNPDFNIRVFTVYKKTILSPIYDLLDRGGKRIRPVLCLFLS